MLLTIVVIFALIGLDQLTKFFATTYLANGGGVVVIPGVLEFIYVENRGAAFSLLSGKQGMLIGVTAIALLVVAYIIFVRKPKIKLEYIAYVLIFTGGVGNLIDRVLNGYVVDFINFLFVNFAVFNVADIFVTFGFGILVFSMIQEEIRNKKKDNKVEITAEATIHAENTQPNHEGKE